MELMEGATQEIKPSPPSKGLAVIITNDYSSTKDQAANGDSSDEAAKYDPLSTKNDGSRLQEAFKAISYDVHWEHNVRACDIQRMWSQIKNLKYEEVKHYRCIVFIFSGHGEQSEEDTSAGGKLVMQDSSKVRIFEEFIAPLLPGQAPSIGRIPKVFIIDACRGGKKTEIVQVPRKSPKNNSKGKDEASPDPAATADEHMRKGCNEILNFPIPKKGNFLVSFSTLPGCISNDIQGDGSAWLKLLAEEIPISHESIDNVLTGLNKKLHDYYRQHKCEFQQPQKVSTLNDVLRLRYDNTQSHADGSRHLLPSVVQKPIEPHQLSAHVHIQQPISQRASEAPSEPVQSAPGPVHISREVVQRPKYKKGTGKYCIHLKQFTNPKFDYITDQSSGSSITRHRCTISYWKEGKKLYAESGYCTSIMGAEEQAIKKILSREKWPACD